ncbi:hypothetical protein [Marinoscillum furvescens]|uniref:Lipoprotein n=1 Tax=Marinoscillum furvescens DSM 4134 TaxID=1122208 RepID=A0A3D9L7X2_MARFU|nr:hypothetical protein [Marinoscillum furvescens]REE01585.1 hypothetical protein C7460_103101 [Marinoscillum furvescens DSM 4134]
MIKVFKSALFLFAILTIAACSSGKKALQKGNYDKAVMQAINRLRANDDHKKASSTLRKAYQLAVDMHLNGVQRAKASNDLLKWEGVAYEYQQINYLYDQILRCPGCREVVNNPVKYDQQQAEAERKAADARYQLGVEALKFKQNRAKAVEAHQHFLRVRDFVPRYKDVEEKLQEALFSATLKVVIEPIPSPTRIFDLRHEFFVNKINEYLHNHLISEYVRFYTPDEVRAQQLDYVDHVIQMEFDRFSLGNVFSNKTVREVSRDSVELAKKDGEPVYGTVKATITEHEKAITGGGLLDFQVYDNELNKVISHEKFPSEYTWSIRWANFNGDERALSEEDLALVNRVEAPIPNPQWMFEEFTAPLYDQVISKLRDFYRRY